MEKFMSTIPVTFNCDTPQLARAMIDHWERIKEPGQHIDNPAPATAMHGNPPVPVASYNGPLHGQPPVTSAPAAPAGELDAYGVPYNPAFHSDNKGRNADGGWRLRRGVDKEAASAYIAQFVAEPAAASAPPPWTASAEPAAPAGVTQNELMALIVRLAGEGKINRDMIAQTLAPFGITEAYQLESDVMTGARTMVYQKLQAL